MTDIPVVRCLTLEGEPRLQGQECTLCHARYSERRLACARCSGTGFTTVDLPRTGRVATYTVVHRSAPGVTVPFVSVVVTLDDGTPVKAGLIDCSSGPESASLGMPVELKTFVAGCAASGDRVIAFGFAPAATTSGDNAV